MFKPFPWWIDIADFILRPFNRCVVKTDNYLTKKTRFSIDVLYDEEFERKFNEL